MKHLPSLLKLALSIALSQAAGIIGSFFTFTEINTWYATLHKPFFNPPNWVFGPVWTILYTLLGISLFLVWKKIENQKKKDYFPVWFFIAHLGCNTAWSFVFFGLKELFAALITIIVLLGMILYTIKLFYTIDKKAALLLLPYLAWVSFATLLTAALFLLNSY